MARHSFFSFFLAIFSLVCFFFSFFCTENSFATPPQHFTLSSLELSKEDEGFFVDISISVDNEDGLRDLLRDGAVASLSIVITTSRVRSWWSDSEVSKNRYDFLLSYMPLTREFEVTDHDSKGNPVVTRDKNLTRLLYAACRNFHLEVVSLDLLRKEPPHRKYSTNIYISLTHKEVPPWLEKSSLFWSAEIVPTEKVTKTFQY